MDQKALVEEDNEEEDEANSEKKREVLYMKTKIVRKRIKQTVKERERSYIWKQR